MLMEWQRQEKSVRDSVIAFTERFSTALKDRPLRRTDYTVETTPAPAVNSPPDLFAADECIEGVHHISQEYYDYFRDANQACKAYLEGLDSQELHILVGMVAEMFSPEDEIGHLRVDKLLKMIQYMKKFNLNLEIIKRSSTNSRKQGDNADESA